MNPSQSIANAVGRMTLAGIFNGEDLVNLYTISDPTFAPGKLQGDTRPTFNETLMNESSEGLYAKNTSSSSNVFPREASQQISRSIDVIEGRLNKKYEKDTSITYTNFPITGTITNTTGDSSLDTYRLIRQVYYTQLLEVPFIVYLLDITWNDNTQIHMSTYHLDLEVPTGYYGNVNSTEKTIYTATDDVIKINSQRQSSQIQIGDGTQGSGITLLANTAGLINAIQTEKHIGATLQLRLLFVRDGEILAGPAHSGFLKVDGATHIVNPKNQLNLIQLSTIQTWENINQISGIRTAQAALESHYANDGFFRNSKNASINKIFKEN